MEHLAEDGEVAALAGAQRVLAECPVLLCLAGWCEGVAAEAVVRVVGVAHYCGESMLRGLLGGCGRNGWLIVVVVYWG